MTMPFGHRIQQKSKSPGKARLKFRKLAGLAQDENECELYIYIYVYIYIHITYYDILIDHDRSR